MDPLFDMAVPPPSSFEQDYKELRELADAYIRRSTAGHTLRATELVHEAYLKLLKRSREYADRNHFFCTAAAAMRHVLVDRARARNRSKRGGEFHRVTLDGHDIGGPEGIDVLGLNDALERLAQWDGRQAQIVELRFFIGLSVTEVAELLNISEKTVKRDWAMARAWLQRELGPLRPVE